MMLLCLHMSSIWFSNSSYLAVTLVQLPWLLASINFAGKPYCYFAFFGQIQWKLFKALPGVYLGLRDVLQASLCQFEVEGP